MEPKNPPRPERTPSGDGGPQTARAPRDVLTTRRPSPGLILITAVAVASFFGLAALGWGDVGGLIAHPLRLGGLMVIGLAAFASLFSGIHLGGCIQHDSREQWRLAPLALISLAIAWWPAYGDRRDLATLDGEACRAIGLAFLLVGAILRVGPMFLLGDRFTWPLATQKGHQLLTTGFYRVIRHPSYGGAVIGGIGWALLFRSVPGLILVASLFPFFLPVIREEEKLLVEEYGDSYRDYQARTWKLIPCVY